MSPDGPGQDAGATSDGRAPDPPADPAGDRTDGSPPTGEVTLARAPRSALVGMMAEPLARSIPVRRSTVLMVVAFLGFGTLTTLYPPAAKTVTTITTTNPNGILPGLLPGSTTTTTTVPPATTTTTTAPSAPTTTTTAPSATTTTGPSPTTTTTRSNGSTTTTLGGTTTTTGVGTASTSTSTAPAG